VLVVFSTRSSAPAASSSWTAVSTRESTSTNPWGCAVVSSSPWRMVETWPVRVEVPVPPPPTMGSRGWRPLPQPRGL